MSSSTCKDSFGHISMGYPLASQVWLSQPRHNISPTGLCTPDSEPIWLVPCLGISVPSCWGAAAPCYLVHVI